MPTPPLPLPTRSRDAHKHACGNVLLVAGATGMSGAAALAGQACLRAGAGLATVACPESVNRVLEIKTTCVMTRPLPETAEGSLASSALEPLRALIPGKDAVAVGPGLSAHPETRELVRSLVGEWTEGSPPLVLDADGLNAFEGNAVGFGPAAGRVVLTPHQGEMRRISGCSRADLEPEARVATLKAFAASSGAVVLLKGHRTLVAEPGGELYENPTGNPGMATAGSGDVLTGAVTCLLAQGLTPFDAARLGAYLHGLAGDIVARRTGWAPLMASDLLEGLIEAIRDLEVRA